VEATGETLGRRDAMGIQDAEALSFTCGEDSKLLLMEVPMSN
jgi:hypothetical protein